jgi:hypothetical protein
MGWVHLRLHSAALGLALGALVVPHRAAGAEPEVAKLRAELAATKGELADTQSALAKTQKLVEDLARKVDDYGRQQPVDTASAERTPAADETARILPVNVDNPSISFVVDGKARTNTQGDDGVGFLIGSAELFVAAPIDPYLRGYASINGTSDESFDVEEAALVTTALPYNLTVKGGRFFADVGRFPHWHDEALPFVERPQSIDRLFGGEAKAEGLETSWLAPTDQYIEVVGGVYNSIGEGPADLSNVVGQPSYSELTYLVHPHTYIDLTDTLNAELGGTFFAAPSGTRRRLYGIDLTLRHQPGTSSFYQGTVVGSEWYWNNQAFFTEDGSQERFHRGGGYAYFESFFGRRFSGGFVYDHAEDIAGATERQNSYSGFLTWMPSEFQRLRFQVDQIDQNGEKNDQRFWLQWTAFLGSHSHGFAAR